MTPQTDKEKHETEVFGCTLEALQSANRLKWDNDPLMLAMSILSDAQEIIAMDEDLGHDDPQYLRESAERVRQYMNRAKYLIDSQRSRV